MLTVATNDNQNDIKKLLTDARSTISFKSDYEPRRIGIKPADRTIVVEYFIPSK